MVFSRKISQETRALVKFLSIEKMYSIRKIAKKVKISKSTKGRYLRSDERFDKTKKKSTGRPKKLSVRARRLLRRSVIQLREINVNFTLKELIRFSGLEYSNTSYSTFYREIKGAGFKFLNARKKGVLNRHDRSKRYKFARKCQRILRMKPNLFHSNISFYLDGVSFVFKRKPMHG